MGAISATAQLFQIYLSFARTEIIKVTVSAIAEIFEMQLNLCASTFPKFK